MVLDEVEKVRQIRTNLIGEKCLNNCLEGSIRIKHSCGFDGDLSNFIALMYVMFYAGYSRFIRQIFGASAPSAHEVSNG